MEAVSQLRYTAANFLRRLVLTNLAIVIPAMNEQASIKSVLDDIFRLFDITVIVVDDCSQDNTAKIASECGAVVLPHVTNLGAWRATQTGIRYAQKHGFDGVITMDADGQHRPSSIHSLLTPEQANSDLVVGSCMSRGSVGRQITWFVLKKLTGLKIADLTSGFRYYSKNAIDALAKQQATMFEYQDVGVLLMLKQLNMVCVEVQVKMNERENGISRIFHSWFAVIKYLIYTMILTLTKTVNISSVSGRKSTVLEAKID